MKPIGFDRGKQYPMLLEIHGGPHGMYSVGFDYMWQTWAANGYVVLYTNPRGSTGYGSAFGNAIDQAYPSVDYDDLMAGVDSVVARGYVDQSRMYVAGCSGGGVLSSWVIGHTTRFAGAAVRCPVTNWLSFAGHTDVPLFTYNFFGAPFWEKPEQWLKQSLDHVRGQREDADGDHDRQPRPPHPDAAERGVFLGAQDPGDSDDAAPVRERMARDGVGAVELDADPVVHDELVCEVSRETAVTVTGYWLPVG